MNRKFTFKTMLLGFMLLAVNLGFSQTMVEVNYVGGSYDGENSWELVDVTAGTQVLCYDVGTTGDDTQTATITDGNTFELITYETFGDGWNGATIQLTDLTNANTLYGPLDPGASNNGSIATCGSPEQTGLVVFSGAIPAVCTAPTVINVVVDATNCPTSTDATFEITDMGDATTITVTNDAGGVNPAPITAVGVYSVTMLPISGTVTITLAHDISTDCDVVLGPLSLFVCTPSNDACAGAIDISGGSASGNTEASTNVESLTDCSGGGGGPGNGSVCAGGTGICDFGNGVWYYYTSVGPEFITVSTANVGTDFDTEIQVFEGTCGALTCVAGDDDGGDGTGNPFDSQVCWSSTASFAPVTYYIYIDGHGSATGNFVLTLTSGALPVELISFDGVALEKENKLTWSTASEENTEYHIVERSIDGQDNWTEIGRVRAAGTTAEVQQYELLDKTPLAKAYYRVKSLDFDLRYEYSHTIMIEREDAPGDISVYPNPVGTDLSVDFTMERAEEVSFTVTDITGKVLMVESYQAVRGANHHVLKMEGLSSGVYFVSMTSNNGQATQRVVKN